MATFDVTLPINKPVVFPPRCVVCEKSNPDGAIKLSILCANSSSTLDLAVESGVFENIDSKTYSSNTLNKIDGIPACKGCAFGLKWYHRLLKFAYYTAWIPGIIPLVLGVSKIISIPFLIVCAIAPGIFTLMFPPSFGASFWDDKANFEFKSQTTAKEFLQLNGDATLKGADKSVSAAVC
jgi:hypothetical protein